MTSEPRRVDIRPDDEPDGATAYQASLRPPGTSVTPAPPDDPEADAPTGIDDADTSDAYTEDDDAGSGDYDVDEEIQRVGYDPGAVSGDTDRVRPE